MYVHEFLPTFKPRNTVCVIWKLFLLISNLFSKYALMYNSIASWHQVISLACLLSNWTAAILIHFVCMKRHLLAPSRTD